jgi:hypothetical protein
MADCGSLNKHAVDIAISPRPVVLCPLPLVVSSEVPLDFCELSYEIALWIRMGIKNREQNGRQENTKGDGHGRAVTMTIMTSPFQ